MRPLSFLSEVEDHIRRLNPGAISVATSRAVDFRQGLARLELSAEGDTVLVQCFELADGRDCLKAIIHWAGSNETREVSVYPNEVNRGTVWKQSAARLAELWLDGAPDASKAPTTAAVTREDDEPMQASA